MATVKIVDRSEMVNQLKGMLTLEPRRTAIVTVDMHRGHLDPKVATLPASPEDCERVIRHTETLLSLAREQGIPVIHVVTVQRGIPGLGAEGRKSPFWSALQKIGDEKDRWSPGRKSGIDHHNLLGSIQTQVIPSLYRKGDYVIKNKKRLNCYTGTDLEELCRVLKVDTVVLAGINTNTCVLNTAFTFFDRDFTVVVISDCVASMYGEDMHVFGLENVKRCLGWVLTVDEFAAKLKAGVGAAV
jgi:nicotinamidase-related amidase